jgi:hypothetical protein
VGSGFPFGFARLFVGLVAVTDGGAAAVESDLALTDLTAMDSSGELTTSRAIQVL